MAEPIGFADVLEKTKGVLPTPSPHPQPRHPNPDQCYGQEKKQCTKICHPLGQGKT